MEHRDSPCLEGKLAEVRCQIISHRRVLTTTSRITEWDVREVIGSHPLPTIAMRMLFEKFCDFFSCLNTVRPDLLPSDVDIVQLHDMCIKRKQRQHLHAIRKHLGSFRILTRHFAESDDGTSGSILQELGKIGVVIPKDVKKFVATAAFSDTDEILSPPEALRDIWKSVGKERMALADGGELEIISKQLWSTHWRVRDYHLPPISEYELRTLYGTSASLASHADHRVPYECGANKYALSGRDPLIVDATRKGSVHN